MSSVIVFSISELILNCLTVYFIVLSMCSYNSDIEIAMYKLYEHNQLVFDYFYIEKVTLITEAVYTIKILFRSVKHFHLALLAVLNQYSKCDSALLCF